MTEYHVVVVDDLDGDVVRHVTNDGAVLWYLSSRQSQENAARMIRLIEPGIHPDRARAMAEAAALPTEPALDSDSWPANPSSDGGASAGQRALWFAAGVGVMLLVSLTLMALSWGPYFTARS